MESSSPSWGWRLLLSILGLLMLGCPLGPEELEPTEFDDTRVDNSMTDDGPTSAGALARAETPAGPVLVYLNRGGGTYKKSRMNNASKNESTAVFPDPAVPGRAAHLPAYKRDDFSWNELMECVQQKYMPYNVLFVDTEPGDLPHTEIVIGGTGDRIGVVPHAGGYAPGHEMCADVERAVGFVFADNEQYALFPADQIVEELCLAIAHEVGHTFGLVHSLDCGDIMSYVERCDGDVPKTFLDKDVPSGTFEHLPPSPQDLRCGEAQNSHKRLLMNIGERR